MRGEGVGWGGVGGVRGGGGVVKKDSQSSNDFLADQVWRRVYDEARVLYGFKKLDLSLLARSRELIK